MARLILHRLKEPNVNNIVCRFSTKGGFNAFMGKTQVGWQQQALVEDIKISSGHVQIRRV
ncbi:hypothetical protein CCACVL1_18694 [Corchorus capsularis]|uniref:Uncharacterized protein n=1 Tax=Corchorus capsularis TaxID=210143 RepID=A0A1R3HK46_COCAP|nr:hypothetical protein CCACVL1_18694 [Corchorus capsularis]